jgi:hypothetical protein
MKNKPLIVLIILGVLFALGLLTRYHGYSLESWKRHLDFGGKSSHILLGKSRWIRADDWMLEIPIIESQKNHSPSFPQVNVNLGLGENTLLPFRVPAKSLTLLFRPATWGFFFGSNLGLSWMWCFLTLGLFYSLFLLFMAVTGNRFEISLAVAAIGFFSPYFQFWAFHKSEILMAGSLVFVSFLRVLQSRSKISLVGWSLLFAYSIPCFLFQHLYPAIQILEIYFVVCLVIALWFQDRSIIPFRRKNLLVLMGSLTISLGFCFFSYQEMKSTIEILGSTSYPGRRVSLGGGGSLSHLFSNHFLIAGFVTNWTPFSNVCESAAGLYFFPVIWLAWAYRWVTTGKKPPRFIYPMSLLILLFLIFYLVGFPTFLSKASLFYLVLSNRIFPVLLMIDLVLLAHFLSERVTVPTKPALILSFLWLGFLIFLGRKLNQESAGIKMGFVGITSFISAGMVYVLLSQRNPKVFLGSLLVLVTVYTASFNPVAFGGMELITESPLAKAMRQVSKQGKVGERWVTIAAYDEEEEKGNARVLSQLPRMLNLPSLDGFHLQPELKLWQFLDPDKKFYPLYNQCGFIVFQLGDGKKALFSSPSPGQIFVTMDPLNPFFEKFKVRHFLVTGEKRERFAKNPHFIEKYCGTDACIYDSTF